MSAPWNRVRAYAVAPVRACFRVRLPCRLDLAWRQTAMALWEAPDVLPFFVVAQPVSKFVCGGADLMLPGVRAISHESLREGSLAAIKVAGNPLPFAVGVVLFDPSQAAAAEGRVLQLLQTYRDGLWEAGGEAQPNAGFRQDQVFPTEVAPDVGQPAAAAAVSTVAAAGAGGAVGAETEGQECRGEDRPAVGTEEQTRGQTDAEQDEEEDGAGGEAAVEDEEEDGAGGEAAAEMDALLEKCFLQVRGCGTSTSTCTYSSTSTCSYIGALYPARKVLSADARVGYMYIFIYIYMHIHRSLMPCFLQVRGWGQGGVQGSHICACRCL